MAVVSFTRGKFSISISGQKPDQGFVKGYNIWYSIYQLRNYFFNKSEKSFDLTAKMPGGTFMKPMWMSKMVQSHHWNNIKAQKGVNHTQILIYTLLVILTRLGFNPCPFYWESIAVYAQILKKFKIIFPAVPMINSLTYSRVVAILFKFTLLFPITDIIINPPFNLKSGGCCTPKKIFFKSSIHSGGSISNFYLKSNLVMFDIKI